MQVDSGQASNSDSHDLIEVSPPQIKYTATGRPSGYIIHLYHKGLNERKHVDGLDENILAAKAHNQLQVWQQKYDRYVENQRKLSREEYARQKTAKLREQIADLENTLHATLEVDDTINWDDLKYHDDFTFKGSRHSFVQYRDADGYPLTATILPPTPRPTEKPYFRKIGILRRIFGQAKRIRQRQQAEYDNALVAWKSENHKIERENERRLDQLSSAQQEWQDRASDFAVRQSDHNAAIDKMRQRYYDCDSSAIVEYCDMVLSRSAYPDWLPRGAKIEYGSETKILLVELYLPSMKDIPAATELIYIRSRGELKIKDMSKAQHARLYEGIVYQIVLRTIHELFEADVIDAIDAIILNGMITDTNSATGKVETKCIVSIQVSKGKFEEINLESVDPKECFKFLRGIGSARLSAMTAVKPIVDMSREDKRFRPHYDVAESLSDGINIAAMDWADFEHLVREVFEREFAAHGGEVKVTQASADGGVDAIAFDPDPIRGGKIVIQAKRYTNVVGVSAVRDLYGTMMNEGASKGILVTTSDYGADSYEFAKDKPLTLLNGANLLYLLEKHGHRAKIDLKEAKRLLTEG